VNSSLGRPTANRKSFSQWLVLLRHNLVIHNVISKGWPSVNDPNPQFKVPVLSSLCHGSRLNIRVHCFWLFGSQMFHT